MTRLANKNVAETNKNLRVSLSTITQSTSAMRLIRSRLWMKQWIVCLRSVSTFIVVVYFTVAWYFAFFNLLRNRRFYFKKGYFAFLFLFFITCCVITISYFRKVDQDFVLRIENNIDKSCIFYIYLQIEFHARLWWRKSS